MNLRARLWIVAILAWAGVSAPTSAQMHDHAAMSVGDGQFNPFVVADAHGGFYAVYIQHKNGKSDVFFQHARAGSAFSAPVRVNDRLGDATVRNENPPKVAGGPGNEIYVAWANERERFKGNIRFSRSLDGGKTFSPAVDLNSDMPGPAIGRGFQTIAVDSKGRVLVAWIDQRNKKTEDQAMAEIWMAESEDRGKTFSHDRKIVSNVCDCCRLALALDSTGRIFISYRSVPPTGPMFRDIAVARSEDGGKTFRSAIVNHDGWELHACPTDGASLTIDRSGRLDVAWFTAIGDLPRLFIASSSDHGASFGKPALLDPAQKQAKHAHVVAIGEGLVLAAWDDVADKPIVQWGIYDLATRSVRVLGSQKEATYPIVAISGKQMAVVAMQPEHPDIFRTIGGFGLR